MTMKLLMTLACAFALVHAYPRNPPANATRNTIFADELFQGEIFENVEAFTNIQLYNEGINPYRLPTTTKPSHYKVFWDINIDDLTYSGTVEIQLAATQPGVNEIVIHSDHTLLSDIRLTKDDEPIPITYRLDPEYQFLRVRPNIELEYNADSKIIYILSINFNAPMRTDMYGIYQSWFRTDTNDPDSELSWMATTQFQATAARYAFPCYDEPSFKATFDIIIRRPTTHKSWSCTSIIEGGEHNIPAIPGYAVDVYNTTPVMSTYLLALIVADYKSMDYIVDGKLLYEVIAREQALDEQGVFAFEVGQDLLTMMNIHTDYDFFEMDKNLKMTQAAIPDFSAGAMENWGLLTYREAYLMYKEGDTNSFYKQLIAYILSHEIAHMWFGNLVTCDWWDYLWLNEGFARYYQYFLTHWVVKEMEFETRFVVEQVHTALLADSNDNAHPLSNPGVGSPGAVSAMFSTISYNKGAAIIRQTEHLLGTEVHTLGLRKYLKLRKFETAKPIDLFQVLESVGIDEDALTEYGPEFNFIEYYKSWTEQPGHPVLNVHVNHATGSMTITQRRFSINSGFSDVAMSYIVPISFATASDSDFSNTKPSHVLTDTVSIINRGTVGDEWVIFNKQQTGFYRVNYDDYTWDLIAIALRDDRTSIHEYNRAQIVNDVFQFARSGIMSYNRALNILAFLENETEYAPWFAAITGFNWIRNRLASTPEQLDQLNKLIESWATKVMTYLTYEPHNDEEPFIQSYLRYQLAPVMCNMEVEECRSAAKTQFEAFNVAGTPVPVDSRHWVYCNALRDGTAADFTTLWQRFLTHNVYTEKIVLLQSLGCTSDSNSLNQFLTNIVTYNHIIRRQDYNTVFNAAVSGREENTMLAFTFVKEHFTLVRDAFGSASTPLGFISSRLRTREDVLEFQEWVVENRELLGTEYNGVYNSINSALASIQWAEDVSPDLNEYFTGEGHEFITTTRGPETTVEVITITPSDLEEPVTPDLPLSAVSTFVSVFLLSLGVIVHLFL